MRKTSTIIGALLILATVLIFQLAVKTKLPNDYVSVGFILLSEIIATIGVSARKSSDLEALSVSGTLTSYMIVCILFSVIFGRIMIPWFNIYLLIHILLIIATATIVIFAHGVSKHNQAHDAKIMSQLVTMRECEAMIQTMYLNAEPQYRDELRKVYESVKYVDKASDINSADIMMALDDLKTALNTPEPDKTESSDTENDTESKAQKIGELSTKIISLVNERIAYNTSLKHGSF